MNIGPCGTATIGEPPFLSEELEASVKESPDLELVLTSGHGKNGALTILQKAIRPQVYGNKIIRIYVVVTLDNIFCLVLLLTETKIVVD